MYGRCQFVKDDEDGAKEKSRKSFQVALVQRCNRVVLSKSKVRYNQQPVLICYVDRGETAVVYVAVLLLITFENSETDTICATRNGGTTAFDASSLRKQGQDRASPVTFGWPPEQGFTLRLA